MARNRLSTHRGAEIRAAGRVTTSRVIWAVNDIALEIEPDAVTGIRTRGSPDHLEVT
jgi:hypothetical protein